MRLILIILETALFLPLSLFFSSLPLFLTCLVWSAGAILGGFLGHSLAGSTGWLLGSTLGAGLMAGAYAVFGQYFGFGAGAGWRYWRVIHEDGIPDVPQNWEAPTRMSLRPLEVLLDIAAACLLAALCSHAESLLASALAGALTFAVWGGAWGLYLGATRPRGPSFCTDFAALCLANLFCPRGTPWPSLLWLLGCCAGYALQALPVGTLPGLLIARFLPVP